MGRLPLVRSRLRLLPVVVAALGFPVAPAAAGPVPPEVAGLLPAGTELADQSWDVLESDFGTTYTGAMRATIPGQPLSCDSTVGPELRVSLKGDTAWEEPPMLDMAIEMYESSIAGAGASLAKRVTNLRASNASILSVSPVQQETLPNGVVVWAEQNEECESHRGANTLLRGFARQGATTFELDLFVTAGSADALALAKDALARFEKLDVLELLR